MKNVIIIHGTGGSPDANWFPWLKERLEKLGNKVLVPKFPTPQKQCLDSWLQVFENYKKFVNEDTIFIGHSLGTAFLLCVLERLEKPIKASFFVAGFTGLLDNPDFDDLNKSFTFRDFKWDKIKSNCKKFYVINSDNDPYVPLEKGGSLSASLYVEPIVIRGAGHINKDSGYDKFDFLLDLVKKEI